MSHALAINRRTFLQSAGALLSLPFFESLGQGNVEAGTTRFCFLYVPNGVSMENWRPKQVGSLAAKTLPPILRPLAPHLDYVTVVGGLDNRASERSGRPENLGQHARSIAALLSAAYPTQDVRASKSFDVVLAQSVGADCRIPLLSLTTEYAEDQHDAGYGEIFNYSLSWKDERTPILPMESPRQAFEALCGRTAASIEPREAEARADRLVADNRSVLDRVLEGSKSLGSQLNPADRVILEEYLEDVRSVERRLGAHPAGISQTQCRENEAEFEDPKSIDEQLKIMLDLLYLALRSDSARVATLLFGAERSERDFGFLTPQAGMDMSGGHHSISHHRNKPALIRKYVQIGLFHTRHLARFVQRLRETREGDGNLMDRTLILYGSSMSDGNTHEHYDLPLLLLGKGNGLVNPGKNGFHVHYGGKPISNLYLTLLEKLSIADSNGSVYRSFGDSGGTLNLPGGF